MFLCVLLITTAINFSTSFPMGLFSDPFYPSQFDPLRGRYFRPSLGREQFFRQRENRPVPESSATKNIPIRDFEPQKRQNPSINSRFPTVDPRDHDVRTKQPEQHDYQDLSQSESKEVRGKKPKEQSDSTTPEVSPLRSHHESHENSSPQRSPTTTQHPGSQPPRRSKQSPQVRRRVHADQSHQERLKREQLKRREMEKMQEELIQSIDEKNRPHYYEENSPDDEGGEVILLS
jgi:hypothetical protein